MPHSKTRRSHVKTRKGGEQDFQKQFAAPPISQQSFSPPRGVMQMQRNLAKINRIDYGTRNYRTTIKNLDKNFTRIIKGQKSLQKVGKQNILDQFLKNPIPDPNRYQKMMQKNFTKLATSKTPKAFKFDLRKTIKSINKYIGRERKNDRQISLD